MDAVSYQEFLTTKIKDLELCVEKSMKPYFKNLKKELKDCNILLWPDFYFGNEWGCVDKTISICIPFYFADEKLRALEYELPKPKDFLKILRHETGHAVNYAYKLWKRKDWKETFGNFHKRYPKKYLCRVNPWSKSHVKHLHYVNDGNGNDPHYAQKHPDEDWAETFAVWLDPKSGWKTKYKNWPVALQKLEYVNTVIGEIGGQEQLTLKKKRDGEYTTIEDTVSEWYGLGEEVLDTKLQEYITDMNELFSKQFNKRKKQFPAQILIRKCSRMLAEQVGTWILGSNKNSIRRCLRVWETICRNEGLKYSPDEEVKKIVELSSLLTYHTTDSIGRVRH